MSKSLYKHSYRTIVAMAAALLVSSTTAMVFAAETATVEQAVAQQSEPTSADVASLGRFVVTPKSASFEPSKQSSK